MEWFNIMGLFNDTIESGKTQSRGTPGPPGPKGNGFKVDIDSNYSVQNTKIAKLGKCTSENDATNKKYGDKFLPVNLTGDVFKNGIAMEGEG